MTQKSGRERCLTFLTSIRLDTKDVVGESFFQQVQNKAQVLSFFDDISAPKTAADCSREERQP